MHGAKGCATAVLLLKTQTNKHASTLVVERSLMGTCVMILSLIASIPFRRWRPGIWRAKQNVSMEVCCFSSRQGCGVNGPTLLRNGLARWKTEESQSLHTHLTPNQPLSA